MTIELITLMSRPAMSDSKVVNGPGFDKSMLSLHLIQFGDGSSNICIMFF